MSLAAILKAQIQFDTLIDSVLKAAVTGLSDLDVLTISAAAGRTSEEIRELGADLAEVRSDLPDGRKIFTPQYDAVLRFAKLNHLRTDEPDFFPRLTLCPRTGAVLEGNFSHLGVTDLTALAELGNLKALSLQHSGFSNLTALYGLHNLRTLDVSGNFEIDFTTISQLSGLEHLTAMDCGISDLSPLASLTKLTTLVIHSNPAPDIEVLAHLVDLTCLHLAGLPVTDIRPLERLQKLRELSIAGGGTIKDLSVLSSLPNLVHVCIDQQSLHASAPTVDELRTRGVKVDLDF